MNIFLLIFSVICFVVTIIMFHTNKELSEKNTSLMSDWREYRKQKEHLEGEVSAKNDEIEELKAKLANADKARKKSEKSETELKTKFEEIKKKFEELEKVQPEPDKAEEKPVKKTTKRKNN